MTRGTRHLVLVLAAAAAGMAAWMLPPVPQDPAYHAFADTRTLLGVPNALNVLSNLAFAFIGAAGLAIVFGRTTREPLAMRRAYITLFAGAALTAVGSALYHLDPRNATLVWDRLPMTLGFMGLLGAVLGERVSPRLGQRLLLPLLALGAFSVLWWYAGELRGSGDLRLYGLVQFGSICLLLLVLALYPATDGSTRYLLAGIGLYAVAKGFELADAAVLQATGTISGHSAKHLVAAAAIGCVAAMLHSRVESRRRRCLERDAPGLHKEPSRGRWTAPG